MESVRSIFQRVFTDRTHTAASTVGPHPRTTLTLSDSDPLRGTSPAVLFECGGRILGSSAGDDGTFLKSWPVQALDYLLSHSWHAAWRQKFLTLFIYINGLAACLGWWCGAYVAGACVISARSTSETILPFYAPDEAVNLWVLFKERILTSLASVFSAVIFASCWSRLRSCLFFRSQSVFLDKV